MIHLPFIPSAASTSAHPKHARGAFRLLGRLAVAIAVVGLGGCGIFGPTTDRRVIGGIDFHDRRLPEIPETATAGVPFEMTIWTAGNSCYYSLGFHNVNSGSHPRILCSRQSPATVSPWRATMSQGGYPA